MISDINVMQSVQERERELCLCSRKKYLADLKGKGEKGKQKETQIKDGPCCQTQQTSLFPPSGEEGEENDVGFEGRRCFW